MRLALCHHTGPLNRLNYALIQDLQLSKGKKTNIYTDSRYAFATLHVHGSLYKEKSLLTSSEKDIKNKEEILTLLDAVWEPEKVAVMHCWGSPKRRHPTNMEKQTNR